MLKQVKQIFTPCTPAGSLLEPMTEAAKDALAGGASLLSPTCSSFDRSRNDKHSGEVLCSLVKSIGRGVPSGNPNINGKSVTLLVRDIVTREVGNLVRGFVRENPGAIKKSNHTSKKGREQRQQK
jgi:hypothetical protein